MPAICWLVFNLLFLVLLLKVSSTAVATSAPMLYGFAKSPKLGVQTSWSEAHSAMVQAGFHKASLDFSLCFAIIVLLCATSPGQWMMPCLISLTAGMDILSQRGFSNKHFLQCPACQLVPSFPCHSRRQVCSHEKSVFWCNSVRYCVRL